MSHCTMSQIGLDVTINLKSRVLAHVLIWLQRSIGEPVGDAQKLLSHDYVRPKTAVVSSGKYGLQGAYLRGYE